MQPRRPIRRLAWAVAASSITATAVAAATTAGAPAAAFVAAGVAPCAAWTGGDQPPDPGGTGHNNTLSGVAVLSPCNAWAVGSFDPEQTLIVHWDGASWTQVPSPDPGIATTLSGVSAVSASDVWAVGQYYNAGAFHTLIVHWDGTSWTQVPSPDAPGSTQDKLLAVRATSATSAWAVGSYYNGSNVFETLILHWDGTTWTQVASPDPAQSSELTGVAATSASNAWAVGYYYSGTADQSLILHWDGTSWTQVTSPNPGSVYTSLSGVRATSPSNAWAVGSYTPGGPDRTLILHWDGSAWKQVTSPNPGGTTHDNDLSSVAATSANDAWAAGGWLTGPARRTFALHWDGSAWQQTATPDLGAATSSYGLNAVGASSAGNVWAVGSYSNGTVDQTLALHCC
jgi:hypothetical protein